jgi:hypothetical protein
MLQSGMRSTGLKTAALIRIGNQPPTAARIAEPASATALSASSITFTIVKNPWICDP